MKNPPTLLNYKVRLLTYRCGRYPAFHNWNSSNQSKCAQWLDTALWMNPDAYGVFIENNNHKGRTNPRHRVGKVEFGRYLPMYLNLEPEIYFRFKPHSGTLEARTYKRKEIFKAKILNHMIWKINHLCSRYEKGGLE